MKHKEYIIPIGEDALDYDEMFIGVIRRQPELIRCKDCVWFDEKVPCCRLHSRAVFKKEKQFCSWAEPKEEKR